MGALAYAELAGRFDGIGSAYQYVYYVLGEFAASIIGISTLIESIIGLASIILSLSVYTDKLIFNGAIIEFEKRHFSFGIPYLSEYCDLFGLLILLVCGLLNLSGVKQTLVVSLVCNIVVLASLVLIVVVGFVEGSFGNWFEAVDPAKSSTTTGGYAPYGMSGVFTGASLAYFSYNGFDAIASLGCEAKRPSRDIPLSILLSFGGVMALYLLVCGAITYIAPYYTLSSAAGMALAFHNVPWMVAVVSLGAVLATATGSFSSVLASARITYSMAQDGILFKSLTTVSERTQVPTVATAVTMVGPALGILMLNIEELVMMNSGGLLICFCLTNICVIVGRYQPELLSYSVITKSEKYSIIYSFLFWAACIISNVFLIVVDNTAIKWTFGIIFAILAILVLVVLSLQLKEVVKSVPFLCPWCPWVPGLGIYMNSAMMVALPAITWARVFVCLVLGLICYFSYGLQHSNITVEKRKHFSMSEDSSIAENYSDNDTLIGNEVR